MKIAVVGANGQLGSDIVCVFREHGEDVVEITHGDLELADAEAVQTCIANSGAQMVVNTAAMHHVERCEQQPGDAFAVNAVGARNLALATREMDAVLVHISTDYVFDGAKSEPYVEEDVALPLNVYGNSKLAGEAFVRTVNPRHFVLRVSAIYGKRPCRAKGGLNFVELMLKLGRERGRVRVVNDEFVSPTPTIAIARQIAALKDCKDYGLYHATSEGSCSWHQYAKEIFATAGLPVEVEVADSSEFPAKVQRPRYAVIENKGLKAIQMNVFQPWEAGLRDYLLGTTGA